MHQKIIVVVVGIDIALPICYPNNSHNSPVRQSSISPIKQMVNRLCALPELILLYSAHT